jgi:hypothetical protein
MVLVIGGALEPHLKKKIISGAIPLLAGEGSEGCMGGVMGLVEAAELATGSMLA